MAGLELDIQIVEKVFQYELMPSIYYNDLDINKSYYAICGSPASEEVNTIQYIDGKWEQYCFNPSTWINDAWVVIEHFTEGLVRKRLNGNDYRAWIMHKGKEYVSHGRTPSEAICKTALKAVGYSV